MIRKFTLTSILFALAITSVAQVKTVVEGKIEGRETAAVVMAPLEKDMRHEGIEVPVKDGLFTFTLTTPLSEIYQITFVEDFMRGAYRPAIFCADGDTVRIKISGNSDFTIDNPTGENKSITEFYKFVAALSKTSKAEFRAREDELRKTDQVFTVSGAEVFRVLKSAAEGPLRDSLNKVWTKGTKDGSFFTPQYLDFMRERESVGRDLGQKLINYEKQSPSLYSLCRTLCTIKQSGNVERDFIEQTYGKLFSTHPYYKSCLQYIAAKQGVRVGGKFADFEAPSLDGKMHRLSHIIKGKVAVVDLWASWCGPCREHSIAMIPLYEKYAGDDFTIVGVAGEFKNDKDFREAIVRDGYKWINLLELDRRVGIWDMYAVGNGGGKILLIDRQGTIIAENPTVEDIEKALAANDIKPIKK